MTNVTQKTEKCNTNVINKADCRNKTEILNLRVSSEEMILLIIISEKLGISKTDLIRKAFGGLLTKARNDKWTNYPKNKIFYSKNYLKKHSEITKEFNNFRGKISFSLMEEK